MPAKPVRIVSRLFTPEVGAAAFRLRVLADSFSALGHRVEVLTTRPPGGPAAEDGAIEVSRWPVLRDGNGNVRGYVQYLSFDVPALFRMLLRRRPALLVAEPPPTTGFMVRIAAAIQRVPYVYYAGDVWSDGVASMGAPRVVVRVMKGLESWVLRGAATVLAVSDGVADRVRAMGVLEERLVVVGNGIDTETFSPEGPMATAVKPYFVYAGTMSEWQGAEVFIRALAEYRRVRPDTRLVFVGQGSDLPHLRRLADEVAPGAVQFEGVVPPADAAAWLRGAQAALVSITPGRGYDFAKPTKIYAATGCGVPVIFAGHGASEELVAGEQLGWAPGYDAGEIARAMEAAADLTAEERKQHTAHLVDWTRAHASLSAAGRAAARSAADAAGLA